MEIRDRRSTEERLTEFITVYSGFIEEDFQYIEELKQDEEAGTPKNRLPNLEVIKNVRQTISLHQNEVMLATYSAGFPLETFKKEYLKFVESLISTWYSNSGYTDMLWALSIGILLEIDDEVFDKLVDLVRKDDPVDYLIDYLIHYRQPDWAIRDDFMFPRPYVFTEKITQTGSAVEATKLLQFYLEKEWYQGHRDTGWYDLHKVNIDNYYGYWSFEAGAICKIMGLNPDDFKEVDYFPYDLVVEED
ncbi:PoNe immunity protein domain-containing protein [Streptococcus oricebi]|uniref:DUF1911 domain-containing protein n=1 Tax=Streptococcus oricebi TaxID=1547447 RepID=A0ABS5B5X5_9STRE|nr:PoNe immunity protein domain-containing protein [Streptococcus oricebi]MBP2624210.1 hypothetical protein [Streptococcus oricebi]